MIVLWDCLEKSIKIEVLYNTIFEITPWQYYNISSGYKIFQAKHFSAWQKSFSAFFSFFYNVQAREKNARIIRSDTRYKEKRYLIILQAQIYFETLACFYSVSIRRRRSECNMKILNVIACLCSAQILIVQSMVGDMYT